MPVCTHCGVEKAADNFTRSRPRECRDCTRATQSRCPSHSREANAKRVREWRERGGPKVDAMRERKNARRRRGKYRERSDRKCRDCKVTLTPENNEPHHGRRCRSCRYKRQLQFKPPAERNADQREWRAKNRERSKAHQAKFHETHPEARAVYMEKQRARRGPVLDAGDLTRAQWLARLEEFGHACAYCLRTDLPLTQDHVEPLSRGGRHTLDNVVPACQPCNSTKHDHGVLRMASRSCAA
jgi:hypothetical protein